MGRSDQDGYGSLEADGADRGRLVCVPQLGAGIVGSAATPAASTHQDWSTPPGSAASLAAVRPSLTPRWNPASRSRAAEADRFSTTGCVAGIAPGTRLAFGSRLGSPADV